MGHRRPCMGCRLGISAADCIVNTANVCRCRHNKQRLASSNANFARSRTVSDKTCTFPANFLGCDIGQYAGESSMTNYIMRICVGASSLRLANIAAW